MSLGVVLYGPPAVGKDTVTGALHQLDPRYGLFRRLKAGPGRTAGYRLTDEAAIAALRQGGQIVWENRRYGALYVVDRPALVAHLDQGVPVVHLGQAEAIDPVLAVVPDARWLVVALRCPRDVAAERITARATGDTAERLHRWDQTPELDRPGVLAIDTARTTPHDAAAQIHQHAAALSATA
ncbi:MAG: kinase [Dehalococcoidia bacterium]